MGLLQWTGIKHQGRFTWTPLLIILVLVLLQECIQWGYYHIHSESQITKPPDSVFPSGFLLPWSFIIYSKWQNRSLNLCHTSGKVVIHIVQNAPWHNTGSQRTILKKDFHPRLESTCIPVTNLPHLSSVRVTHFSATRPDVVLVNEESKSVFVLKVDSTQEEASLSTVHFWQPKIYSEVALKWVVTVWDTQKWLAWCCTACYHL